MIALIDGDVLAHMACSKRPPPAAHGTDTQIVTLNSDGVRTLPEYTKEEDTAYLMECWDKFQRNLTDLCDTVWADDFAMAVKGANNYRDSLYSEYKANRRKAPQMMNHFVQPLRELAVLNGLAIHSDGREADDVLRIWAREADSHGVEYIVCSMDKDLKCIPGMHYLMHHKKTICVSPLEAMRHYYEQMLKGDPTDNIPGIPKVGPVNATLMLSACTTEHEFQEVVVGQYLAHYGDDWYSWLLSNAKMIHLQETPLDYFSFDTWPIVKELL